MVSADPVAGGARAVARCDTLGVTPFSDMADGLYRGYLTPAFFATQAQLTTWMQDAGMSIRSDAATNLIGRYAGERPDAPALLIGSHIDSVRDGGVYDGPLGVMLGIECVAALHDAGRRLPFAVEVIAFGDEEGSRFPAAMLTSRAVAGTLHPNALAIADAGGIALHDALANSGADADKFLNAARARGTVFAYLEAHIEQGPVLEAEGLAVGTVTGIAAQQRFKVSVAGMAGHAGTTTMPLRRDALAGAADMVLAVERIARNAASDLVATVGQLTASPGAANVIAGSTEFTIDVRAGDGARRDRASDAICQTLAQIATARGLTCTIIPIHDLPASPCDPAFMDLLDTAVAATGTRVRRLVSGAGHDAMSMAALCPTAMLFIRCRGGVSHNPAEHVEAADAEVALQVMLNFLHLLGASLEPA